MEKITIQFPSLQNLAAFVEATQISNYEVNRNALQLSCTTDKETVELALDDFHAVILSQEVEQ